MRVSHLGRLLAGVTLVDIGQFDTRAGDLLHGGSERRDLGPVLLGGGSDVRREQVSERVHRDVDLGALLALGPVVPGPVPALGRALQGAAAEDHRRRRGRAAGREAQDRPQVMHDGFKAAGPDPALRPVVDRMPGREVVREKPLRRPRARASAEH